MSILYSFKAQRFKVKNRKMFRFFGGLRVSVWSIRETPKFWNKPKNWDKKGILRRRTDICNMADKTEKKNDLQKHFRKLKKIVVNIIIIWYNE